MERYNIGIDPGRFRHLITLLEPTQGTDASGVSITYAPASPPVTEYAQIEYVRGADVIKSGQDVSQTYLTVHLRYNSAFAANKRIQAPNGNQYIILSVENILERNAYLVLNCVGIGANN